MSAAYQRMQHLSGLGSYSYDWRSPYSYESRPPHTGFGTSSTSGVRSSGWTGTLVLAAAVGVGLAGYLIYRQFVVTTGTVRGARRALGGEA
jgi:hypothetical protein